MSDTVQIAVAAAALVGVFVLTRLWIMQRMVRAASHIIEELRAKLAFDEPSAVTLPYARQSLMRLGRRDYLGKALDYLVAEGTVGKTADGRYYLRVRPDGVSLHGAGSTAGNA